MHAHLSLAAVEVQAQEEPLAGAQAAVRAEVEAQGGRAVPEAVAAVEVDRRGQATQLATL